MYKIPRQIKIHCLKCKRESVIIVSGKIPMRCSNVECLSYEWERIYTDKEKWGEKDD